MEEQFVRVGVGVLVFNSEGKVLVGKRKGKLGEHTFSLPGGHLEFGETPQECAQRELKEETDLDGTDFEVVSLTNDIAYDRHYITIGIVAKNFTGKPQVMEREKFENWDWYDIDDLPQPLFVPSSKFIDNYIAGVFYK